MPEADSTRKRSRSPSDAEQPKQHKRANTGAALTSDDSQPHLPEGSAPSAPSATSDVNMSEAQNTADDNTASTPSPSQPSDKAVTADIAEHASGDGAASGDGRADSSATTSAAPSSSTTAPSAPPTANIHMRCLIVTQDASIIIGKGGSHVNEIREKSGARVMVSESIPGNPERILNVSGPLDAVSKVR